jgi:cobalt-zinc-cadmium efflux system membrane fusion protein
MASEITTARNEPGTSGATDVKKPRSGFWKVLVALSLLAAAGAGLYSSGGAKEVLKSLNLPENLRNLPEKLANLPARKALATESAPSDPTPGFHSTPVGSWDSLVRVTLAEERAIGFAFAKVKKQVEPIRLELTGRTAYDTDTITRVRPRFDTRVEKVIVSRGQKVKKGDPLVELYSTDLATAKSDYQTKWVQWQHDLKLLNLREVLVKTGAISQQVWVDTQNDEQKSNLDRILARDKLVIFYEVPQEQVDRLLDGLGQTAGRQNFGNVTDKARMTLLAKTNGYVITREVVPGNYYESTDVLMEIAPLDHLWVWVNVYELDQDKVKQDQTIIIQFPFLSEKITGHVNYVASEVSKDTRAVKIRATIPNPNARLKSDMLVKAMLEIQPVSGQTIIPRLAMISISGGEYVFVRMPRPTGSSSEREADRFQRVKIGIAQENTDHVVVAHGLVEGQEVVTNGSLILAQLYEDQRMTTTGLPVQ